MDVTLDGVSLGAVTIGLTEMVKQLRMPSRFAPPLAVGIATAVNCASVAITSWPVVDPSLLWSAALTGIVVGLTSAGLYRVGKVLLKNNG